MNPVVRKMLCHCYLTSFNTKVTYILNGSLPERKRSLIMPRRNEGDYAYIKSRDIIQ